MNPAEPLSSNAFIPKLQELSSDLFYISESDYPLEPVQFEYSGTWPLTGTAIVTLTGQAPDTKVEIVALDYFFRNLTQDSPDNDEDINNMAQRFRELQAYLQQQLQEVKVYRLGQREIQAYILGKISDNQIAGLKTTVIET